MNVGTILRSSVIFGADKFYLAGRKKLDRRSMVGAQNYIDMVRLDNYNLSDDTIDVASTFDTIRKDGYKIVCCETQQKRIDSGIMDYMRERKENPCFVMGSEGCGLPQEALNNADWLVSIPQFGVMRSYNVATAASIIMYEWMRGK